MSDLREAMAKALYGHQFRADDPVDPVRWDKFRNEYFDQADVVLGVVHEHADIEAAVAVLKFDYELDVECSSSGLEGVAHAIVTAALGGSEKP